MHNDVCLLDLLWKKVVGLPGTESSAGLTQSSVKRSIMPVPPSSPSSKTTQVT